MLNSVVVESSLKEKLNDSFVLTSTALTSSKQDFPQIPGSQLVVEKLENRKRLVYDVEPNEKRNVYLKHFYKNKIRNDSMYKTTDSKQSKQSPLDLTQPIINTDNPQIKNILVPASFTKAKPSDAKQNMS